MWTPEKVKPDAQAEFTFSYAFVNLNIESGKKSPFAVDKMAVKITSKTGFKISEWLAGYESSLILYVYYPIIVIIVISQLNIMNCGFVQ